MNDPFSEELLSAYLDGELPSDERVRVEEWLAASAEHRRLFDDLKAIRRALQALPQQSLDAGFSDRVLSAIRERSGQPSDPPSVSGTSPIGEAVASPPSVPVKPVNLPNKHLGMPAWRWFAAGVAATLLALIAGVNAAPDTMAQISRVAQVRLGGESAPGSAAYKAAHGELPDAPAPAAALDLPSDAMSQAAQHDSAGSGGSVASSSSFEEHAPPPGQAEYPELNSSQRAEMAPRQKAEPMEPESAPPAPGLASDSLPAESVELESSDTRISRSEAPSTAAKKQPTIASRELAASDDAVVELSVTAAQADRALALYAQTETRQASRRFREVDRVENYAVRSADETTGNLGHEQEQEIALQRTAPALSLLKLMSATASGVQIAAVEVTGSEAQVQALLDTLGIDEGRKLRAGHNDVPASGAGGAAIAPPESDGGESVAYPQPGPQGLGAGKPLVRANATVQRSKDAAEGELEEEKASAPAGARGGALKSQSGGYSALKMRSVLGGSQPVEGAALADAKGGRALQQKQSGVQEPQWRVRLVIVPADPIGPTVEIKPQPE